MHRTAYGHGRQLAGIRRGSLVAPKRRARKSPVDVESPQHGLGFETFISLADREQFLFPQLLGPAEGGSVELAVPKGIALSSSRREGLLASTLLHLIIFIIVIVKPDLLAPSDRALNIPEKEPLVLFMEPPAPAPASPLVVPVLPPPPQSQNPNRMMIPKATKPAPPDKQQDFQTDLPFSEGNSDEFYTEKELEDPGEEGDEGDPDAPEGEGEGDEQTETKLADLLPKDGFSFTRPRLEPEPRTPLPPAGGNGDRGQDGGGGPFEDIRRFMQGKQFHNPEGGLVTGRDNTLYYDDKGADFIPWLRRMLTEVRRHWMAGMPSVVAWRHGHVAVAVSVVRNGDIDALQVIVLSGTAGFDNIAVGALRAADLLPLPPDYPDNRFEFVLVFWYNERPYDLF
ncbi:MAG: TonB C-terminal domain-containing protein [Vicinamibacteria bacterium]